MSRSSEQDKHRWVFGSKDSYDGRAFRLRLPYPDDLTRSAVNRKLILGQDVGFLHSLSLPLLDLLDGGQVFLLRQEPYLRRPIMPHEGVICEGFILLLVMSDPQIFKAWWHREDDADVSDHRVNASLGSLLICGRWGNGLPIRNVLLVCSKVPLTPKTGEGHQRG
jgi:hypothetical protein